MASPVDIHPVDAIVCRSAGIGRANQIDFPAALGRALQDVVQMQLGTAAQRIVDIPPVQCQDLQDRASMLDPPAGLRASTPIVGVVYSEHRVRPNQRRQASPQRASNGMGSGNIGN